MLTDLVAKKDALRTEMRAHLDKALHEKRELTPDETLRYDALDAQLKSVQGTLDRANTLGDLTPTPLMPPVLPVLHDRADVIEAEARVLAKDETFRSWVQKHQTKYVDDDGRLRLGSIMRAMIVGPRNDLERRALAEGADATGGITVPDLTSAAFIDRLRAALVVIRAGAVTVPLRSDITKMARLTTDPTAAWRAEAGPVAESDPALDGVTFAPKSLDVFFKVSRELVEDSLNIEDILEMALLRSFSVAVDAACLTGSGTSSQPLGLRGMTSVNQVVAGGGTTAAQLLGFEKPIDTLAALWGANVPTATAMLMAPRTLATLSKLRESATSGQQLIAPSVLTAFPWLQTTSIPINETQGASTTCSTLYLGDFSQMMLGVRTDMTIEVARELYRGNYQFGFFGHLRMDMQVKHQESFARLVGIMP
jgi:HK97 family phage major capsid protein